MGSRGNVDILIITSERTAQEGWRALQYKQQPFYHTARASCDDTVEVPGSRPPHIRRIVIVWPLLTKQRQDLSWPEVFPVELAPAVQRREQ